MLFKKLDFQTNLLYNISIEIKKGDFMDKIGKIKKIIEENNGILLTRDLKNYNIQTFLFKVNSIKTYFGHF